MTRREQRRHTLSVVEGLDDAGEDELNVEALHHYYSLLAENEQDMRE